MDTPDAKSTITSIDAVQLLKRVEWRLLANQILASLCWAWAISSLFYLSVLLASRMTGYGTVWLSPRSLLAIPVVALAILLFRWRPLEKRTAAREIDRSIRRPDLFLTYLELGSSAGQFQELVTSSAVQLAATVKPSEVVPWRWSRSGTWACLLTPLVMLTWWLCPQLDPFAQVAKSEEVARLKERLVESRQATSERKAAISAAEEDEDSDESKQALDDLKQAFERLKPPEKTANLKTIQEQQKRIGDLWRKAQKEAGLGLTQKQKENQQFGRPSDDDELRKASKDFQETGSPDSLQKQMEKLEEDLKTLQKEADPVAKQEQLQKLQKQMKEMERLAKENMGAQKMAEALSRAQNQLSMGGAAGDMGEAIDAALDSLDLAEEELAELAEALESMKEMEKALEALQHAKKVNDFEKLDGEQCKGCKSMGEYRDLLKKLGKECSGQGEGEGEGMAGKGKGKGKKPGSGNGPGLGGEGIGEGGIAPEDDSVETDFQAEQVKSAVTAGKMILNLKTKGKGKKNDATQEYSTLVNNVKQGAQEAIMQEQVPPGYHDAIKSYFDTLSPDAAAEE